MEQQAPPELIWRPQPGPQAALVECPVYEVFYGGARGGGKTDAMIGGDWPLHAQRYGQYAKGIFFRRELPQLEAAIARSKELYYPLGAVWNEQKKTWQFPNGATLKFRPLERDSDAEKYQGHDYTRVYFEELTNYPTPAPVLKMHAVLRSGNGIPCGMRATGNPGGPGHQWVKARYIDPAPGGWKVIREELPGGIVGERVFIPAKVSDNRQLMDNDPGYIARLHMAGSATLVKAWLNGDWSVVEGAFFDCWSASRHVVRPFEVPAGWARFRSGDWGSAKPFSIGWWAVVTDPYKTAEGIWLPRGCLVRYREWYGCVVGKPNTGLKLTAEKVGEGIWQREEKDPRLSYGVLDPAAFAVDGGPSIAERIRGGSGNKVHFKAADNTRVAQRGAMNGWDTVRSRLVGDADGNPMVVCFSTCTDSIRTIPALQHDAAKPEDLDSDGEDHAADDWRYGCNSRPWARPSEAEKPKPKDRYAAAFERARQGGMDEWKVT